MPRKPTGRLRGGQPGNKNAQTHSIYSELYTVEEQNRLAQPGHVEQDQGLLRTLAFRIGRHLTFETLDPLQLKAMFPFLLAIQHINTIERTVQLARGKGGALGATILEALAEMDPDEDLG